MKRAVIYTLIGMSMGLAFAGCRSRAAVQAPQPTYVMAPAQQPPQPQQPSANLQVTVQTPVVTAGVTIIDNACNPNAPEACNGLDDNCNGVIDEGCGVQTGNIQVTLAWGTGADLDLYVTDPYGNTLSYQNRQAPSGGVLDHDARGACNARQADNTIENVYWNTPQPPSGQYRVDVHYWGDCGVAGVTQATLSIAVGGQIIGAYNVMLQPRQRQTVAMFTIP